MSLDESLARDLQSKPWHSFLKQNPGIGPLVEAYLTGGPRPNLSQLEPNHYAVARVLAEDARREQAPTPPGTKLRDKPPGWPDYAGFQTIDLAGRDWVELPDDQDFLVNIGDYVGPTGPQIMGGRRVVAIGGRITVTGVTGQVYNVGIAPRPRVDTSHHYYEGLRIRPAKLADGSWSTMLHDGIAQRGARGRVTFQNCLIGPTSIKAGTSDSQGHSDSLQFQSHFYGQFRADKMTSLIDYTAVMASEWEVTSIDLSRWNFSPHDVNPQYGHQTAIYAGNPVTAAGVRLNEVYFHAKPGTSFASGFEPQTLAALAKQGNPPGGDFVQENEVGPGYVSPGYL